MPNTLISGPAGAGKSQVARAILATGGTAIMADFQSLYAALTGVDRLPDGTYPRRNEALLPIVEYVRRAAIGAAVEREIEVVATNSDGDMDRRNFLLAQLGPGATERVVDPGLQVVRARLTDAATGEISMDCEQAVQRWYGRL